MKKLISILLIVAGCTPATIAQHEVEYRMLQPSIVPEISMPHVTTDAAVEAQPDLIVDFDEAMLTPSPQLNMLKNRTLPSDGFWYRRPNGTFYDSSNQTSSTKYVNVVVPMFIGLTWRNMAPNPTSVTWFHDLGRITPSADGNYTGRYLKLQEGYSYLMPKITNGVDTFFIGCKAGIKGAARIKTTDQLVDATHFDLNGGYYAAQYTTNASGSRVYFNPFGKYSTTTGGTTWKTKGLIEYFNYPMRSMMVDEIWWDYMSLTGTPFANNASLTLSIYKWDGTDQLIYRTTVDKNNITTSQSGSTYSIGQMHVKTQKKDVFGNKVPLVINTAFYIVIEGFDSADVNFSLYFANIGTSNNLTGYDFYPYGQIQPTRLMTVDTSGNDAGNKVMYNEAGGRQNNATMFLKLMFDVAACNSGFTTMTAPDEGGLIYTDINGTRYDYMQIYTTFPWKDEDDNEYYYFDDMPEWLMLEDVDDSNFASGSYVNVRLSAEPLPDGTDYREASFNIISDRGARGQITVTQGTKKEEPDPQPQPLEGDVNLDGQVNAGDISAIYGVILGSETDGDVIARADVNSDDNVNAGDISAEYDFILAGN